MCRRVGRDHGARWIVSDPGTIRELPVSHTRSTCEDADIARRGERPTQPTVVGAESAVAHTRRRVPRPDIVQVRERTLRIRGGEPSATASAEWETGLGRRRTDHDGARAITSEDGDVRVNHGRSTIGGDGWHIRPEGDTDLTSDEGSATGRRGRANAPLIDRAVAVVVEAIADLDTAVGDGAGGPAHIALVDPAIAVVVDAVADLGRARMDVSLTIITVVAATSAR